MTRATGRAPCSPAGRQFMSTLPVRTICCFRSFQGAGDRTRQGATNAQVRGGGPMKITRRDLLQGTAATALAGVSGGRAAAQGADPIRVGLLTVKTGPLASGGIDMERALVMYFKDRDNMLSGRKIELYTADTAGVPATARTKAQELVEKN